VSRYSYVESDWWRSSTVREMSCLAQAGSLWLLTWQIRFNTRPVHVRICCGQSRIATSFSLITMGLICQLSFHQFLINNYSWDGQWGHKRPHFLTDIGWHYQENNRKIVEDVRKVCAGKNYSRGGSYLQILTERSSRYVARLLHNRQVPGSDFGPENGNTALSLFFLSHSSQLPGQYI